MTSLRNRMLAFATVALAAFCATAIPAAAQPAFKGSFTLSREVRWQNVTLPAGEYTFRMKSASAPSLIVVKGPQGGATYVSALVADRAEEGTQSVMTIEHRGSNAIVRELYLAPLGIRLRYHVPKAPKEVQLAKGPVTIEHVLVAMK